MPPASLPYSGAQSARRAREGLFFDGLVSGPVRIREDSGMLDFLARTHDAATTDMPNLTQRQQANLK